jgi:coenzyme F420-0:L-glutamate ligase / coenzyme F420-1:gamma-L-glutamate ligase
MSRSITLIGLDTLPMIAPGDDLGEEILRAARRAGVALEDNDIVVLAQKIVSKAEARLLPLDSIEPSQRALELARETGKDPRLVEAVLRESVEVLRTRPNVIVVEHRLGHVMANAGIDRSNLDAAPQDAIVLLLPEDPDLSAAELRRSLQSATGKRLGIMISDSFGRAWRLGTVGVAIGVAGPPAVVDRRGDPDLFGRPLEITEVGFADAVCSAAVLAMGEGNEGCPVVIVRGLEWPDSAQSARDIVRPRSEDLFR